MANCQSFELAIQAKWPNAPKVTVHRTHWGWWQSGHNLLRNSFKVSAEVGGAMLSAGLSCSCGRTGRDFLTLAVHNVHKSTRLLMQLSIICQETSGIPKEWHCHVRNNSQGWGGGRYKDINLFASEKP